MAARFFSFDASDGVEWHDTRDAAIASAAAALQVERDNAEYDGHWSDEVSRICWGEVQEVTVEEIRTKADEDEEGAREETYSEYSLQPLPQTVARRKLLERLRAMMDRAELHQVDGRSFIEIPRVDALELADLQHRLDLACRSAR